MISRVEQHDDDLAEIGLTEDELDAMMAGGESVDIGGPPAGLEVMRFELYAESVAGAAAHAALIDQTGQAS
jgi:hypothetical protein